MGVVAVGPHPKVGVVVPRALLLKLLEITTGCKVLSQLPSSNKQIMLTKTKLNFASRMS